MRSNAPSPCSRAWPSATADVPDGKRIAFRIGVNLGDIIVEGDDIYGDGVNVAARIQEIAEPGGVALSSIAHDQIAGKVEAAFKDAGEHDLKNIAKPVRVFHWADGSDAPAVEAAPLALPDKPSIAVLPFVNMSPDADQEFFSDGISEDIITALSKFRSLFVIARNSSFSFKGQSIEVKDIGHKLGVRLSSRAACGAPATGCASPPSSSTPSPIPISGPSATTATSTTSSRSRTK